MCEDGIHSEPSTIGRIPGNRFSSALVEAVNINGENGAFYGNPIQLWYQTLGILVTCAYSAMCTAVILVLLHFLIGIRINRLDQARGLDNVAHGVIEQDQPKRLQDLKMASIKVNRVDPNEVAPNNIGTQ